MRKMLETVLLFLLIVAWRVGGLFFSRKDFRTTDLSRYWKVNGFRSEG